MIKLTELTIFQNIQERLDKITPELVELSNNFFAPVAEEEKVVGVLDPQTRPIWALIIQLKAEFNIQSGMQMQLLPSELLKDHEERAVIAKEMYEILVELVSAQSRADVGFWDKKNIGIRKGYQIVIVSHQQPSEMFFLRSNS